MKQKGLYEFEGFRLDASERTLWRENETVSLTPKALEALCLLVENRGKLLSKDDLMNALWADTFVEERNLAQNIFTLRKALGESAKGAKFIETVPRRGYRFVADVRPVEIEEEEFIEVSLAEQTIIKAEGNVSSHDLTEAVRETAKSLAFDKKIEKAPLEQAGNARISKPFYKNAAFFIVPVVLFALVTACAFWFFGFNAKDSRRVSADSIFSNVRFDRLTDSGKAFLPAISPDKKQIVYVYNDKGKDSLKLQNLATGSITEVVPPADGAIIASPFFSKDGDYIFYRFYEGGKEGAIYKVPIFGGHPRRIIGEVRSDAARSPDGSRLSFIRFEAKTNAWQLIVCRADGTDERVAASRSGEKVFLDWGQTPAWSPDGQKIVIGGLTKSADVKPGERKIYLLEINLADASERVLPAPAWNEIGKIVWHPDQNALFVIARESREKPYQIWHISYPGGEAKRVTNDLNNYIHLDIAPDGEFILTAQRETSFNLWTVSLAEKRARQITFKTGVNVGAGGVQWSPDGKQIVFTVDENAFSGNIWTIDVETEKMRQLTFDENKRNWLPVFTPDGGAILFASDRAGKSNIWQMDADGNNLRQITGGGGGEGFPQITPDGNWLIYVSPADTPQFMHKRPLHAPGESVIIYDSARGSVAVSPDSKKVLFGYYDNEEKETDPWKYGIKSLEPGDKPQEIRVKPHYASIAWKKDGSGFFYVSEGRTLNNIWFYDVADNSTKQITDFDNMKFRFLSLSPDETQTVAARSSTVSNVIKITGF